ncbi:MULTISPECIES: helix-turn-helix domain-containing protein [Paenibacillus]|uniref:helix-turn-helix domain-containing protein n=1 Tax=Paenibacillus TaxID=44249 RepID=UPI00096DB334|nr:helix-turn-helix transcriptional regulator [Paenibacillus odorifer]OME53764.1 transcriptional regulator [Paenibacillus odorifer]
MGHLNLLFIKKRRLELNLSLQEMAESLGFKNASTYMKYEEGTYSFKANHLPILANKLDGKIENFFIDNFAEIAKLEHSATKEVV